MASTREKLNARINRELGIAIGPIERLYPSPHQKSAGAFRWRATVLNTGQDVGSEDTMGECLSAGRLHVCRHAVTRELMVSIVDET
ncbi:MAG: hypothetical protein RJQ08_05005 [Salinisphaeraceae bacterium]